MIEHRFRGCVVREYPDLGDNGHLVTVFPDGAECPATRDMTMQNEDYARHLGYAHVRDALREHELAHVFVCERLGMLFSPTLRFVATGRGASYEQQLWEEAVVLSFQRYMQTGEMGPALRPYAHLAPEWAQEFAERYVAPFRRKDAASRAAA